MAAVSSTTSTSSLSTLSAKTGIAGLVSGLDTDSIVESMTLASRTKISNEQSKVTKLQWKQTAYRNVTKALKEFQTKYLDVLSKTNMRSSSMYNMVSASTTSTAVSVSSTSKATAGSITINSISQLATSQTVTTGAAGVSKAISGTADVTALLADITDGGVSKSFKLTLDGKVKTITMDAAFVEQVNKGTSFEDALQQKVTAAFGEKSADVPTVSVSLDGSNKLSFTTATSGSQLTVNSLNSTDTLDFLGLTNGQSDKLNTNLALNQLPLSDTLEKDTDGKIKFTINAVDFTFEETDTLATVMSRVNSSDAGVTLSYSSISDKFTMTAEESGIGDNITISETDTNLMTLFGMTEANSVAKAGQNAILEVNGQEITRTSNSVEIDGVKVELLAETATEFSIALKDDTSSLKDNIKNFVTDYNNIIDMVNGLIKETKDSDFQPLTDEQKKEMSETEIKEWETKAKVGLLSGDGVLKGIASKMQSLMYSSAVSGGISLYNIGITSAGYTENGKLVIDEEKLDAALATKGSAIKELFTTEKTGLANQLNSIINSATKTTGVKGTRGSLVEVAGYESTTSDTDNNITKSIEKMNKTIKKLKAMLEDEETRYWNKFTALETAMSNLNTQSSMLTSFSAS